MATLISKKAIDGKEFRMSYKYDSTDKKYFVIEDECGTPRTKQQTIKAINDMIDSNISDYEFDNDLK